MRQRTRIGLNGFGAGLLLLVTAGTPGLAETYPIEPALVLVGHIKSGGPQQVLVGQDSFDSWSLYTMEIVARPAGTLPKNVQKSS